MVLCPECKRPYLAQTARAGRGRRINDAQAYRHRASAGHCCNRQVSARKLEPDIWSRIARLLDKPDDIRQGYYDSLEQQKSSQSRQRVYLETLYTSLKKTEQERRNLNAAYIDPDIPLTRAEFIEQKNRLDDTCNELQRKIEETELEISDVPTPADLENLENFLSNVRVSLNDLDPSPQEKREILELLHVKVYISPAGEVKVDGWFNSSNGLVDRSSTRCDHKTVAFSLTLADTFFSQMSLL